MPTGTVDGPDIIIRLEHLLGTAAPSSPLTPRRVRVLCHRDVDFVKLKRVIKIHRCVPQLNISPEKKVPSYALVHVAGTMRNAVRCVTI